MEIDRITQGGVKPVTPILPGRKVTPGVTEENFIQAPQGRKDEGDAGDFPDRGSLARGAFTPEEAKKTVEGLNSLINPSHSHLKFTYHEKLGEYYVQIINDQTNEVIREIPPKKLLDLVAGIWEQIGLIVDEKV